MQKIVSIYLFVSSVLFLSAQDTIGTGIHDKADSAAGAKGTIYTFVEEMPKYIGEDGALIKFIKDNLRYPQMEKDNHIQGKVLVRFVIEPDGAIIEAKVVKRVSMGLDKEAMRIAKLLKFTPGKQQGKPVRVYYNLPIEFKL